MSGETINEKQLDQFHKRHAEIVDRRMDQQTKQRGQDWIARLRSQLTGLPNPKEAQ